MLPQKQNKKTFKCHMVGELGVGGEQEKALAGIFKPKFLKTDLLITDLDLKLCVHSNVSTAQNQLLT